MYLWNSVTKIGDAVVATNENVLIADNGYNQIMMKTFAFKLDTHTGLSYNIGG